jgi:pyruvate dehydrogenase E1 component beta subunit
MHSTRNDTPVRVTYAQGVREALAKEMRRNPTVFILGEEVAEAGPPFNVLSGTVEEFGKW